MFRSALFCAVIGVSGCTAVDGADDRAKARAGGGDPPVLAPTRQGNGAVGTVPATGTAPLLIATYDPAGPSMLARMTFVLAEQDGCLVGKIGGDTILPVFKAGSIRLAADGRISYGGRDYRIGDELTVGGGTEPTSGQPPRGLDLKGCRAATVFLVG